MPGPVPRDLSSLDDLVPLPFNPDNRRGGAALAPENQQLAQHAARVARRVFHILNELERPPAVAAAA